MPLTAPAVTAAPSYLRVSASFIDHSGDPRTVSLISAPTVTPAQVQAYMAALGAASNANLWQIEMTNVWAAQKLASLAVNATYPSVYDNVVLLVKLNPVTTQDAYIPAPQGVMIPAGDIVDTSNTLYTDWRTAVLPVVGAGYGAVSTRFTERREKNDSVPAG